MSPADGCLPKWASLYRCLTRVMYNAFDLCRSTPSCDHHSVGICSVKGYKKSSHLTKTNRSKTDRSARIPTSGFRVASLRIVLVSFRSRGVSHCFWMFKQCLPNLQLVSGCRMCLDSLFLFIRTHFREQDFGNSLHLVLFRFHSVSSV